jgi:hypothetical protein
MEVQSATKVVTTEITLNLTMTLEEATALMYVMDRVGGHPETTGRGTISVISDALVGMNVPRMSGGRDSIGMPNLQEIRKAVLDAG